MIRLAERWADFTKACAIYPDANTRVRRALDEMIEALPAAYGEVRAGHGLEICFSATEVHVAGRVVPFARGSNLEWLADRLHRAALAGVELKDGATLDSVLRFTKRLLAIYTLQDVERTFDALWPDATDFEGLRLVDRRFAGTFGERHEDDERPVSWGESGLVDLSSERPIASALSASPRVAAALARLQSLLDASHGGTEEVTEVEVLARLLRQMPRDVMHEPRMVVRLVEQTLDQLAARLEDGVSAGACELPGDADMVALMFEASQGLLGRANDAPTLLPEIDRYEDLVFDEADPPATGGASSRDRDRDVQDDPGAFWADVSQLPEAFKAPLTRTTIGSDGEQSGVFLHFLADAAATELHPFARTALARLLARPSEQSVSVLASYLRPDPGGDRSRWEARYERLVAFLRESRLAGILRRCDILTPQDVRLDFPRDFGLYIDAIEPSSAPDLAELAGVVASVGRSQVLAARDVLVEQEGILDPRRVERIVASPSEAMLPLLRILIDRGDPETRRRAVAALKKLQAEAAGACLLFVVDQPELLPRDYLLALTDVPPGADDPGRFRIRVAQTLAQYLDATAGDTARTSRRLYAIQHLRRYMTSDARAALERILGRRRWFVLPSEPKAVREAAHAALRDTKAL